MKKNLAILVFALFVFGCSGNSDQPKEASPIETETIIEEANLQNLENAAGKIIEEADELENEVNDLIENL